MQLSERAIGNEVAFNNDRERAARSRGAELSPQDRSDLLQTRIIVLSFLKMLLKIYILLFARLIVKVNNLKSKLA